MLLSPLIKEVLLNSVLAGSAVRTAKKTSAGIAIYLLAGCIGFLGIVFLSIASNLYLQQDYTAPAAAAMTGSAIMVLAIAIGLFGHFRNNKSVKRSTVDHGLISSMETTLKSFMDGIEDPVKDNPKTALLMAALAGFAAGDKLN